MSHTSAGCRITLLALLAAAVPPAHSLGLGEAELRSALAEPLDLVIAISVAPGESLGPDCFRLAQAATGALPSVTRALFTVEPGPRLRVRTVRPVNEPATVLRLDAACPGGGPITREYPLLLDPRPVATVPAPVVASSAKALPVESRRPDALPAAPGTPMPGPGATRLRALPGDTLAGIATAIFPKNARAREAYLAALRESNPSLAGLAPDEPIALDAAIELPDLRSFAQRVERPREKVVPKPAPAPAPRAPAAAPKSPADAPPPAPPALPASPAPRASQPASKAAARAPTRTSGGFVLRLSGPEIDLTRSRGVDDRTRAQLRERLVLLDADDQVSALLQLRHNVRQLENRVSELQLRLSGPPAAAVTSPPQAAAPPPAASKAPAEPKVPAAPPPAGEPKSPAATQPAGEPTSPAASKPEPAPAPPPDAAVPSWGLAALATVALLAFALFAYFAARRRVRPFATPARPAPAPEPAPVEAPVLPDLDLSEPAPRASMASDAPLDTRIGGADPELLRRRYLEQRFPEIANGTLDIADPDSVVKGARLFYEDGSLPRAVELLQFAIEENPAEMKPWLALFEIFRLEHLAGEFGTLASRFRERHGASGNWHKVQLAGREIDPQNPLYLDEGFDHFETVGSPEAARARAARFDPLAENWLNAPMDFTSDALAAELRRGLLADAGLSESDLVPNPMPALKQVEMFTVA